MKIRTPNSCCTDNTWFFWICFMDFLGFVVWEISGTLRRSISKSLLSIRRCISFSFCMCNVSKYCFLFVWKANKVEVGEYDVFMNDFHLCTLESARSSMSAVPGPLIPRDKDAIQWFILSFRSFNSSLTCAQGIVSSCPFDVGFYLHLIIPGTIPLHKKLCVTGK